MSASITDDEMGKTVKNADGDDVGMVADVRAGTAYVEPDPGLTDQIKGKLGWTEADEDTYPLDDSRIDRVDDDAIWLRSDL